MAPESAPRPPAGLYGRIARVESTGRLLGWLAGVLFDVIFRSSSVQCSVGG